MGMTYRDLLYKATRLCDESKITLGQYEEMTKPLDEEVMTKADYENRLKADMVAMLTEIQLEIEEKFNDRPFSYNHHQRTEFYRDIDEIIQQKIDALKGVENENNSIT